MTVKITTPNGGADSLDFGCARTAIVATVTGTEVSSGEGKLELKTTTGGTSAAKLTIAANGAVTLATPLPLTSGGSGFSAANSVVQIVNLSTGAVATGTTTMPIDDTIPQKTEGNEFMTLAITPKHASNKLHIEVVCQLDKNADGMFNTALFQDTTANAIAGVFFGGVSAGISHTACFSHFMAAGTTSATTFKVRAGCDVSATMCFNGRGTARIFGGVSSSSITITEYSV